MEVTPTRRSARIAALQKKKEEESRNDASTTTNPKISPKKAQASKKGNARKPKKKAQAPKNVHTPTQKKAQASNDGIGQLHDDDDVDGLTKNLQNFSINSEEDSVSSPDEDEGSIYEEESEDESVDEDARKPTKSKSHTPRKSEPDSQQEDETNTLYSISFGTCYLREADRRSKRLSEEEAAAEQAKKDARRSAELLPRVSDNLFVFFCELYLLFVDKLITHIVGYS